MTDPRFKVGDRVYIPKGKPPGEAPQEVQGVVLEVYPGMGPGAQFVGPGDRTEWSSSPQYLVDFGTAFGSHHILEVMLEPAELMT